MGRRPAHLYLPGAWFALYRPDSARPDDQPALFDGPGDLHHRLEPDAVFPTLALRGFRGGVVAHKPASGAGESSPHRRPKTVYPARIYHWTLYLVTFLLSF